MSDTIEDFRTLTQIGQAKRKRNRAFSPQMLTDEGISYEEKNGGAHLIVNHDGRTVDFWPGTGKWISRSGGDGRGVKNLIALLKSA